MAVSLPNFQIIWACLSHWQPVKNRLRRSYRRKNRLLQCPTKSQAEISREFRRSFFFNVGPAISKFQKTIDILLVEDSETDAELAIEALRQGKLQNTVNHVKDGEQALQYLRNEGAYADAPRPDLILLDLNMPKVDGREVLRQIRADEDLKVIPVVVLTTSSHDRDIHESYGLAANSYIVKPVNLSSFFEIVREINNFWVQVVSLPPKEAGKSERLPGGQKHQR